jgi:hypothetical protein
MIAPDPARHRFQSLVALGLAASGIARRVGLSAASEVWGGDEPRERAAWYLWLRDHPGAWQVELAGAEPLAAAGGGALLARFTVRHYPGPGAAELASFSAEERSVAAEALDDTGTPRIELASSIPEAMFTVGTIDWALQEESGASAFALASLDRLRTRREDGEVVRDVPGWGLTAPIFSLVAGLHAQVERRAASRLVLSRQPGFELVAARDGVRPRDAADAVQGEAALLFDSPREPAVGARLLDALRDPDAQVLADVAFASGVHPPHDAVGGDPRLPLRVGHAWFGGAAHAADRVACAC